MSTLSPSKNVSIKIAMYPYCDKYSCKKPPLYLFSGIIFMLTRKMHFFIYSRRHVCRKRSPVLLCESALPGESPEETKIDSTLVSSTTTMKACTFSR
jgi:hypothetical protein